MNDTKSLVANSTVWGRWLQTQPSGCKLNRLVAHPPRTPTYHVDHGQYGQYCQGKSEENT